MALTLRERLRVFPPWVYVALLLVLVGLGLCLPVLRDLFILVVVLLFGFPAVGPL